MARGLPSHVPACSRVRDRSPERSRELGQHESRWQLAVLTTQRAAEPADVEPQRVEREAKRVAVTVPRDPVRPERVDANAVAEQLLPQLPRRPPMTMTHH